MVSFNTKNTNLGEFWRALEWKMLVHFMTILNILHVFGIFYGQGVILCTFGIFSSHFGTLYLDRSGNPARNFKRLRNRKRP
jgi:hypothetical protein